jgi:hypothetical protein
MDNWFPHLLVLAGFGLHISEYVYIVISSCFDSRHFYGLLYLQMRLSSLHPYPWAPWRAFSLLVSSWSRGVYHDEVCASLWKSRSARCQFPVQFCLFIYALELMLFFFYLQGICLLIFYLIYSKPSDGLVKCSDTVISDLSPFFTWAFPDCPFHPLGPLRWCSRKDFPLDVPCSLVAFNSTLGTAWVPGRGAIAIYLRFFFCSTGAWTQGLHLEPLHQPFYVKAFSR